MRLVYISPIVPPSTAGLFIIVVQVGILTECEAQVRLACLLVIVVACMVLP